MSSMPKARADQVKRVQALANLVAAMLSTALVARAEEQATMLRNCACLADTIAGDLAVLSGEIS